MAKIKVAVTQMNILWEDKEANKTICERIIANASEKQADIVIFPEMTLTGFTMNGDYGENFGEKDSETAAFFKNMSRKYGIDIIFGMIQKNGNDKNTDENTKEASSLPFNASVFIEKGKIKACYRKIHPFTYGGEREFYDRGDEIVTTDYRGGRLSMFICYDLRFPEIFQQASKDCCLITVIANWPNTRVSQWDALLRARAIENQSFVVGVNRTGNGGGQEYVNSSVIYSPYGIRVTENSCDEVTVAEIDLDEAEEYRKIFPVKDDRRESLYKIYM